MSKVGVGGGSPLPPEIENEVRKLFARDQQAHREFIEKQAEKLMASQERHETLVRDQRVKLTAIVTAVVAVIPLLFGGSIFMLHKESKSIAKSSASTVKNEIVLGIQTEVDNAVAAGEKEIRTSFEKTKAEVQKDLETEAGKIGVNVLRSVENEASEIRLRELQKAYEDMLDAKPEDLPEQLAALQVRPGTVVPYAGHVKGAVDGGVVSLQGRWLLCDGAALSSEIPQYRDLYLRIGTAWGDGSSDADDKTDFNLPDLRGMFLRGVDHGVGNDPDAKHRTNAKGESGGVVGSTQEHQMEAHTHRERNDRGHSHRATGGTIRVNGNGSAGVQGSAISENAGFAKVELGGPAALNEGADAPNSGAETRPVNAYVNWIIKY